MTPSLFAGTDAHDEYTFMQTPGAVEKLRAHQRDFIREEDFRWMASHGINAVRIPVGYWLFEGDGPYRSCVGRLDWAVRMAAKYQIKVLISLHGAPGSQNGEHHSGRIGTAEWYQYSTDRAETIATLVRLAERYRRDTAVWGIELLNEPKAYYHPFRLRRFYREAYHAIQAAARPGLVMVFSDAFTPRLMAGALVARADFPVAMDTHWYHFFVPNWVQRHLPLSFYYRIILPLRRLTLETVSWVQPVIVGEWSGILGGPALDRYLKSEHQALVVKHLNTQIASFRHLAGWFYWSYKTESRGIYHFRSMVEDGHVNLDEK